MPYDTRFRFDETTNEHAQRLGRSQRWTKIRRRALLLKLDGLSPEAVQERMGSTNCPQDLAQATVDALLDTLAVRQEGDRLVPLNGTGTYHIPATQQSAGGQNGESSKQDRARAGVMIGHPPYGYRQDGTQFVLIGGQSQKVPRIVTDKVEMNVVLFLFEQYIAGKSFPEIANTLNIQGYRTRKGKPWDHETLRDMLRNPTYAGYILYRGAEKRNRRHAGTLYRGLHPAIVSWDTFCQAQDARVQRHPTRPQARWVCPWAMNAQPSATLFLLDQEQGDDDV